ncbi:uncharacterized protein BYT42DRAFT_577451 [Radiomyces spectabilis]|uniref:uncharacterized protein n=1 Tax=Radiomyces spectabilis TaxID=64574 RepID=UPI002220CB2B|nr:uncharacterized protein BYT42DRAFT_577451 [Radiomyces spectabilis]KAI8374736.1 hypothetical protein BYT42DRAFT_577451 [Radiomyces spectabilis]
MNQYTGINTQGNPYLQNGYMNGTNNFMAGLTPEMQTAVNGFPPHLQQPQPQPTQPSQPQSTQSKSESMDEMQQPTFDPNNVAMANFMAKRQMYAQGGFPVNMAGLTSTGMEATPSSMAMMAMQNSVQRPVAPMMAPNQHQVNNNFRPNNMAWLAKQQQQAAMLQRMDEQQRRQFLMMQQQQQQQGQPQAPSQQPMAMQRPMVTTTPPSAGGFPTNGAMAMMNNAATDATPIMPEIANMNKQAASNRPNSSENGVNAKRVETILAMNQELIRWFVERYNNGIPPDEEVKTYKARLQSNLTYLATMADIAMVKPGEDHKIPAPPDLSPLPTPKTDIATKIHALLSTAQSLFGNQMNNLNNTANNNNNPSTLQDNKASNGHGNDPTASPFSQTSSHTPQQAQQSPVQRHTPQSQPQTPQQQQQQLLRQQASAMRQQQQQQFLENVKMTNSIPAAGRNAMMPGQMDSPAMMRQAQSMPPQPQTMMPSHPAPPPSMQQQPMMTSMGMGMSMGGTMAGTMTGNDMMMNPGYNPMTLSQTGSPMPQSINGATAGLTSMAMSMPGGVTPDFMSNGMINPALMMNNGTDLMQIYGTVNSDDANNYQNVLMMMKRLQQQQQHQQHQPQHQPPQEFEDQFVNRS